MELGSILLLVVSGLASGMIFYLGAAGLSIIIAGMDNVNFGAGAFYMLGSFMCFYVTSKLGFGWALLISPIVVAAVGFVTERVMRPLYGQNKLFQLLYSMGVAYIIQDVLVYFWGYKLYTVKLPAALKTNFSIFSIRFPVYYLFIIVFGGLCALLLYLVFYKTKVGIIFRAIISDRTMVNTMGINVKLLVSLMYTIAMGLTGAAGALVAPTITVTATDSLNVFVNTMTVLRIGGWKSLKAAFVSSLMIGVINAFSARYLGQLYSVVPTAIMLVVLLVKPEGLFATKELSK